MKTIPIAPAATLLMLLANTSLATVYYVDLNSTNPVPPYTSWATAATNIQNAVMTASTFDTILATNGIYETGGAVFSSMSNRVYVATGIILKSVNGPSVTFIKGHWDPDTNGPTAVRCVYLQNSATLSGFTLTNGAVYEGVNGGGVYCELNHRNSDQLHHHRQYGFLFIRRRSGRRCVFRNVVELCHFK